MRVGLLLLVTTDPGDVGRGGLSVLLLHDGLQRPPLGQLLLVGGMELAGRFFYFISLLRIFTNTFHSSLFPPWIVRKMNVPAREARLLF